jgi:hypothetical protein
MTLKEVQQLIDGKVYLFIYEDKTIKRMHRGIMRRETNLTNYIQHYALLSTLEPTPAAADAYRIDQLELIGVYQNERDGDCL